jgi:tRNA nucleotidyltransferase (CCA-adding enzyme)
VSETSGTGEAVLARLRELPGGRELLDVADEHDDVELIGGAVRDILLDPGATPRELDVVVEEDAAGFAGELASRLDSTAGRDAEGGLESQLHERFRTALVRWSGGRVDVATRRSESYPAPGALPVVAAGTREQDILRRDFTVNTIAVALGRRQRGSLIAEQAALDDLAAGRLRVLHADSFRDDPTRLLRLARYSARLGFAPDELTARLAAEAIADGALRSISGARAGAELRLALSEPDPVAALQALDELGALQALSDQGRSQADDERVTLRLDAPLARAARALLASTPDARGDLLLLASLLLAADESGAATREVALRALLDELELSASERDRVARSATLAPVLQARLKAARLPSSIYGVLRGTPLEAVALAGAIAETRGCKQSASAAGRWLSGLRDVRLAINGDDLLAAGVAPGPEVGRRLQHALLRKLDGELAQGREAELHAALEEPSSLGNPA